MKTQLKYEFYKLWKRKFVFLSFVILLGFCLLRVQSNETSEYKQVMKSYQAILEPLHGVVDNSFGRKIDQLAFSYKEEHPATTKRQIFEQQQIFQMPMDSNTSYQETRTLFNEIKEMELSVLRERYLSVLSSSEYMYSSQGGNWASALSSIDLYSYFCIFICIIISCSTIFSHDRECQVEELLLTTKEGRRKSIKAKLSCAFIVTLGIWFSFICFPMLQFYLNYGFGGFESSLSLASTLYRYLPDSALTMFGWLCLLYLLGTMLFTVIILHLTRKTNSMLMACLLSIIFFVAPIILKEIPFLESISYMMPTLTTRLVTSFFYLKGIQIGNLTLLTHELTLLGNSFFLIILTIVLYKKLHCSVTKGGRLRVRSHNI